MLASAGHQRRPACQAGRHVGAEAAGDLSQSSGRKRSGIGLGQQAQGGSGVGRAAAKSGRDRQRLGQAEAPERDARSLGLGGLRRGDDEIVALKRAGERSIDGERKFVAWFELDAVAKLGEANEAAHLVIAVGAAAEHLKGEVELGLGSVAERRHSRTPPSPIAASYSAIFCPLEFAALVAGASARPSFIFLLDGGDEILVRLEREALLPLIFRLELAPDAPIGIAEMIVDDRIVGPELDGALEMLDRGFDVAEAVIGPAETVDVIAVVGLELHRLADVVHRRLRGSGSDRPRCSRDS